MAKTYLYFLDVFTPLPYTLQELLEAWEEDKLKPFKMIQKLVEKQHKPVKKVKLYKSYFNPEKMTIILEYLIEFETGTLSAKIIHAENPTKALIEYYKQS